MTEETRKILIAEDDFRTSTLLGEYLRGGGYAVSIVTNGLQVEPQVRATEPHLVLLDVGLPGLDGLEVCHRLRRFSAVPIIMVSGRVEEIDRALGLEVGADDYVCKPFGLRELAARIKAQVRRAGGHLAAGASHEGFRIDEGSRRISWRDRWLELTPQEYRMLRKLLSRPGHAFSRDELLEGMDPVRAASERAVDSHMKNLRRKIDRQSPGGPSIVSIYGVGYLLEMAALEASSTTAA